jgi:Mannose-6-phosphate isomerase
MEDFFHDNVKELALDNDYFRDVLYTTSQMQLVVMSIGPHEQIGLEAHANTTQFIYIVKGQGLAIVNGRHRQLFDGIGLVIPANTTHNIINTSNRELKLFTLYSPPEH